jgi:uncharacterized protein (TIGR02147 family)
MVNVFEYTDFRKYLAELYAYRKKENPNFSYKYIANKAGFKNKGFAYNIINGNKVLSKSNILKISQALGHSEAEAEYFMNLVEFNQASVLDERNYFFDKLSQVRHQGVMTSTDQVLRRDQYEFFSKWHHLSVRSLIDMYPFKDDYKWLSRMVNPPITPKQARQSVSLLEKIGLIRKKTSGYFEICDKRISTGKEVAGLAVQNFHSDCTDLAKRAVQEMPSDQRNITGLTLGISLKGYERICEAIRNEQRKLMEIADEDDEADRVYQLNFHFFPISNSDPAMKARRQ